MAWCCHFPWVPLQASHLPSSQCGFDLSGFLRQIPEELTNLCLISDIHYYLHLLSGSHPFFSPPKAQKGETSVCSLQLRIVTQLDKKILWTLGVVGIERSRAHQRSLRPAVRFLGGVSMKIHEWGRRGVEAGMEGKEEGGKGDIKRDKERRTEHCSKFVQFILLFLNAWEVTELDSAPFMNAILVFMYRVDTTASSLCLSVPYVVCVLVVFIRIYFLSNLMPSTVLCGKWSVQQTLGKSMCEFPAVLLSTSCILSDTSFH